MKLVLIVVAFLSLCGCMGGRTVWAYSTGTGGDARRGRQLIGNYGCGSCHTIPGIQSATGLVGPPLLWFARRTYIAGVLPNTPDNLVRWLKDPPSVDSKTAMPKLGLTDQDARDVGAYLETLLTNQGPGALR